MFCPKPFFQQQRQGEDRQEQRNYKIEDIPAMRDAISDLGQGHDGAYYGDYDVKDFQH
jgi:hypothetical protein